MKTTLSLLFLVTLLVSSCSPTEVKPVDGDILTSDLFNGIYLADEVFFPRDTLVLNKFQLSDSSTEKKLLVEFRNDSIYLDNYNFGGWYGKWFCDFYNAGAIFKEKTLVIEGQISAGYRRFNCDSDDPWCKYEFQISDSTNHSLTLIKTLDTTNCLIKPVSRFFSRGGRGFTSADGEEIRSDIQLR